MVFIRAAEAEDIPSLQTLFLQLGYQTETAILAQRITAPQSMMKCAGGGNRKRRVWRNRYQFYFTGT
ncbi:acyltransferase [Klebsiella pneumoniae]|uniref:Acyltransferase n=1 Tax=Klebsiella pneumoniae TaxID=573 RepID=A0A2X3F1E1_KLEPN|nr:acyltransferase [Klebsiella pneumoniae]